MLQIYLFSLNYDYLCTQLYKLLRLNTGRNETTIYTHGRLHGFHHPATYTFNANLIEDAFREGVKALVLCNPSNPCGKVFTREELQQIADIVIRYDGYIITDEVYEHIVYAPHKHVYISTLPGSCFFREDVNHLIRFHFAKRDETLLAALDRLSEMDAKAKNYAR